MLIFKSSKEFVTCHVNKVFTITAPQCERTNTLPHSNADSGAFLESVEPSTSGNLSDQPNFCDAGPEKRRKTTHSEVVNKYK